MTAVILDTDIGGDIDDSWALLHMLNCPELDVRMVTTGTGDPTYRAGIVAGLLAAAGRDDIPIGLGLPTALRAGELVRPQGAFAREAALGRYRGTVADDGVRALVDCVMNSAEPVTIVAIGPVTNIAAALEVEPAITENARVVGMLGSVRTGWYGDPPGPAPEGNVYRDVAACRAVFAADWNVSITPLDTCGVVALKDARYAAIRDSNSPAMRALMRNYREWCESCPEGMHDFDAWIHGERRRLDTPLYERSSTTLFDCVAVYMAYDESLLEMETLPIALDDDGTMRVTQGAPEIRTATKWKDLEAFNDHLVERLLASTPR